MLDSANNCVKYSLVGFDDYIITDSPSIYRTKRYKHKTKTIEVTPDAKGLYALYIDKKVAIRCNMERLLTAAKSELDPRDEKVSEIIKFNRVQALQLSPVQRVRAAEGKPELVSILLKEFETPLLSELEKRDLVTEGARMHSTTAAMTYYVLLRAFNKLTDEEKMIATEISREGNERRTQSAEMRNFLDLLKEMRDQFKQLGITYADIHKTIPQVVKSPTFYDEFDEVEEKKDPIRNALAVDLQ